METTKNRNEWKAKIIKLHFPLDNYYFFDVQLWHYVELSDGRKGYSYAGNGKYFHDFNSACDYAQNNAIQVEYENI